MSSEEVVDPLSDDLDRKIREQTGVLDSARDDTSRHTHTHTCFSTFSIGQLPRGLLFFFFPEGCDREGRRAGRLSIRYAIWRLLTPTSGITKPDHRLTLRYTGRCSVSIRMTRSKK